MFPPGNLKNDGFISANASARSTRSPFFRFLYVGGNKLMRLKSKYPSSVPAASKVMASVLFELGASLAGTSSNVCSTHSSATALLSTSTEPNTSSVRFDCSAAVKRPSYVPLTQNEPVYFCRLTAMPQYPSFSKPILPVLYPSPLATRIDAGSALDSGVDRFWMLRAAPPIGK